MRNNGGPLKIVLDKLDQYLFLMYKNTKKTITQLMAMYHQLGPKVVVVVALEQLSHLTQNQFKQAQQPPDVLIFKEHFLPLRKSNKHVYQMLTTKQH